jgi:hypothetical protein
MLVLLMVCTTVPLGEFCKIFIFNKLILVRETALILLQTTPKFVNIDQLQQELLNVIIFLFLFKFIKID